MTRLDERVTAVLTNKKGQELQEFLCLLLLWVI